MSFDMTIRFDRTYSRSVALTPLSQFLGTLPNVKTVRQTLLVYAVRPDQHMEISLETAAEEEPKVKTLQAVAERKVGKARLTLLRLKD